MKRPPAPLRNVTHSKVGPRSQRITFPNGDVAIVCGPPLRVDTLECGHQVTGYNRAQRRRCRECAAQAELPL